MNNKNDDDIFVGKYLKFSLMFSLIFIIVLIAGLLIYMLLKNTKKYKCVNGACVECLDFEKGCQDNCYMCSAQTSLYKPVCKNGKCTCEQCETNDDTCIFSKDTCNKKLGDVDTCNNNSYTCDSGTCKKYANSSPEPSFCYKSSDNCKESGCELKYKCDSNLTCSVQKHATLEVLDCTSKCKVTSNPCQSPPIYKDSNVSGVENLCKNNNCLKIEIGIETLNHYVKYLLTLVHCNEGIRFFETMPPNFPTCAKDAEEATIKDIKYPLQLSIDNNNNLCINGTFSTSITGLETLTGVKNIHDVFYNDVVKVIKPNDVLNITVTNLPVKIYFVKGIPAKRSDCTTKNNETGNITGIRLFIEELKPNTSIVINKNNVPLNTTALWQHISKCINSLLCRWPILIQRIVDLDMSSCGIWKNGGKNKCCPGRSRDPRSNSITSETINLSHYNIPIEISAEEAAYSICGSKQTFTLGLGTVNIKDYNLESCSNVSNRRTIPPRPPAHRVSGNTSTKFQCGRGGCISKDKEGGILSDAKVPGGWTITIGAALLKNITQLGADNIMNTILTIINKKSITIKIGTATYTLGQNSENKNIELTCSSYNNTENCGDKGINNADNCQKCTIHKNPDVVFGKISVQSETINNLIKTVLNNLTCDKNDKNSLSCTIENFKSIPITINGFRVTEQKLGIPVTAKCENAKLNLDIGFKVTITIEQYIKIQIDTIKLNNISLVDENNSCNWLAKAAGKISSLLKNFISNEIQTIVKNNINNVSIKLSGLFSNLSLSCEESPSKNGTLIKLISTK
jgi:hypothetical protein